MNVAGTLMDQEGDQQGWSSGLEVLSCARHEPCSFWFTMVHLS